jgi:hypothetical protein
VWRACDGQRDVEEIAIACELPHDVVRLTLAELADIQLLEVSENGDRPSGPRVSRRQVLRRAALTGAGVGLAFPVIRSITAPSIAMAASGKTALPPLSAGAGPAPPAAITVNVPPTTRRAASVLGIATEGCRVVVPQARSVGNQSQVLAVVWPNDR